MIGALGVSAFMPAWVAFVVGLHFIAFGVFSQRSFFWVGGAILGASIAGLVVGLAGLGANSVVAVTGLIAATALFTSSLRTLLGGRASKVGLPS